MKITVYNANPETDNGSLEDYISILVRELQHEHEVSMLLLRELDLKYCTGCWDCWVKSPGKCKLKDEMERMLESFIRADLVIFAAPMKMGFPSSLMKKVNDRLIPLVHPYITLVNDECHHVARYDRYPYWGLILQEEESGDKEDLEITRKIYERTALNIKSELLFSHTIDKAVKELAYEIDHI